MNGVPCTPEHHRHPQCVRAWAPCVDCGEFVIELPSGKTVTGAEASAISGRYHAKGPA